MNEENIPIAKDENENKILVIFAKWGINYSFCNSDLLEIAREIIRELEKLN